MTTQQFDLDNEIRNKCKLLYESIQLPVFYSLRTENEFIFAGNNLDEALLPNQDQILYLLDSIKRSDAPVISSTEFGESYISIPVIQNDNREAIVLIGPSITHTLTKDEIKSLQYASFRPLKSSSYLQQLPVVPTKRLYHLAILAYSLMNGIFLDLNEVAEKNLISDESLRSKESIEVAISERREFSEFQGLFDIERTMLNSVREGDKSAFINMTLTSNFNGAGVLCMHNRLRNIKNLAICAIALGTRAAIEGGLYPETAYTIGILHIQHVEELSDTRSVELAISDALMDFVERVSNSKRNHYSKTVSVCQEYIFSHLFDHIHLSALVALTGLHKNYLSQLFKSETGFTIQQFIQREKINEAKKLLDLTSEPIATIATRLSYYDESYFIKIFKKHTGITPKRYRDKKQPPDVNSAEKVCGLEDHLP